MYILISRIIYIYIILFVLISYYKLHSKWVGVKPVAKVTMTP